MRILYAICLSALMLNMACAKKSGMSSNGSLGSGLTATDATPYMGDNVEICAAEGSRLRSFTWSILNEDGFSAGYACTAIRSGTCVSCNFDEAGTKNIQLSATYQNGGGYSASSSLDVLDPAQREDQAPVIICDISQGGVLRARISSRDALQSGSTNFPSGTYQINCSGTQDEAGSASVTTRMRFGTGAMGPVPASYNFPIGAISVRAEATDINGNTSFEDFIVYATCPGPNNLAISSVMATHVSGNIVSYSANVTGGTGTKKLIWDYNGDGVYDGDWVTMGATNQKYSVFSGSRTLKVKAWDQGCNYQLEQEVVRDLTIPRLNHDGNINTPAQALDFGNGTNWFIQADLAGLAGNNARHANGEFIVTLRPGQEPRDTMVCPYDPATSVLSIIGYNHYDTLAQGRGRNHGMELRISGVNAAAPGLQAGARLIRTIYKSDQQDDATGLMQKTYQQNDCPIQMIMQRASGTVPCGDGTTSPADVYIFYGKFDCNNMQADVGALDAADGAFYCEKAIGTQCVGGGGGGGGVPRVEF